MSTSELVEMRSGKKPLTLALEEIERGIVGYERTKDSYK
jgi:DNA-directed RNA polymerase subunit K/omega